jgi:hypothetical protein
MLSGLGSHADDSSNHEQLPERLLQSSVELSGMQLSIAWIGLRRIK